MNVIVSNKQKSTIDNANIDAIKDLNGLFSVDDLVNKFRNYFFSKMILDATSVVDFTSDSVLNKLAKDIGSDRLIILLPPKPEPPKEFTDKLINLKIYNFSNKIEDVVKFIDNPLTENDVISKNTMNKEDMENNDELKTYNNDNNGSFSDMLSNFDVSNNLNTGNNNSFENNSNVDVNDTEAYSSNEMANDNNDYNDNMYNNIDNNEYNSDEYDTENNEFSYDDSDNYENNESNYLNQMNNKIVVGIKNVTLNAGSTTLVYLLVKTLREKFKRRVSAVEVNKNDFKYYQDNSMISVSNDNIHNVINNSNDEILVVDLNDCRDTSFCNEVLYLVEPSIIKLNRLMIENRFIFRELFNKKIILNKSLLSNNDVKMLSKEAGVDMFMNIPPVNDRVKNQVIEELIKKIGLN